MLLTTSITAARQSACILLHSHIAINIFHGKYGVNHPFTFQF